MALDPRLSLGVQTANVGEAFNNALLNVQRFQNIQQQPLRNRLLEAQTGQAEAGVTEGQQLNKIRSLAVFANDISGDLANNDLASIRQKTVQRIAQDLPNQGVPSTESQDLLNNVIDNPNLTEPQKLAELSRLSQNITQFATQAGVLKAPTAGSLKPAEQRTFESKLEGLTAEQKQEAVLIDLGLSPRAIGNAAQTIAKDDLTELVADSQAIIKQRGKFAEMTGSSRAKTIDKGFARINGIDKNIRNIDRAISALDAGAGTGPAEQFFPSIKAASKELDQIQGELALDVVGAVTFGALSKGELDLAREIALPIGLDEPELKDFLQRKKAAQTKLRDYFSEQIQFLDQGGTVAGFLRQQDRAVQQPAVTPAAEAQPTQQAPQTAPQVLQFDAEGNLIQ